MITVTQLWFYFSFIATSFLAILAMHFYLRGKKDDYDSSLLWLAGSMAIWLGVILLELKMWPLYSELNELKKIGKDKSIEAMNLEREIEFPSIIRRIASILNSVCVVLFLSYFQEGWHWLNSKIKKLAATPEKTALGVAIVCVGAAFVDNKTTWLRVETAMSILVAFLLTVSFFLTFQNRRTWLMLPLALAGGVMLGLNQLAILAQEQPSDAWAAVVWPPDGYLIFRRILALFILMLNVGALALTWLGKNIESAQPAPANNMPPPLPLTKSEPASTQPASANETTQPLPSNESATEPAQPASFNEVAQPLLPTDTKIESAQPPTPPANSLEIREENGHVVVYLTFSKEGKTIERLSFDEKELTPAKRKFLVKFVRAAQTNKSVKSTGIKEGFSNFSKERDEFIQVLNRKTEPLDIQLSADDLIAPGKETGEYRLTIRPENILVDPAAEPLI